jgi:hypothetical protein
MYYDEIESTRKGGETAVRFYLKRPVLRNVEDDSKRWNYDHLMLGKQIQISVFDPLQQYKTFNKKIERS